PVAENAIGSGDDAVERERDVLRHLSHFFRVPFRGPMESWQGLVFPNRPPVLRKGTVAGRHAEGAGGAHATVDVAIRLRLDDDEQPWRAVGRQPKHAGPLFAPLRSEMDPLQGALAV